MMSSQLPEWNYRDSEPKRHLMKKLSLNTLPVVILGDIMKYLSPFMMCQMLTLSKSLNATIFCNEKIWTPLCRQVFPAIVKKEKDKLSSVNSYFLFLSQIQNIPLIAKKYVITNRTESDKITDVEVFKEHNFFLTTSPNKCLKLWHKNGKKYRTLDFPVKSPRYIKNLNDHNYYCYSQYLVDDMGGIDQRDIFKSKELQDRFFPNYSDSTPLIAVLNKIHAVLIFGKSFMLVNEGGVLNTFKTPEKIQKIEPLNGKNVITCELNSIIRVWDVFKGKQEKMFTFDVGIKSLLVINENSIAIGYMNGLIKIFDFLSGKVMASLEGMTKEINCLAKLNDRCILSGSGDEVILWDLFQEAILQRFKCQKVAGAVTKIVVMNEDCFASIANKTISFWNASDEKVLTKESIKQKKSHCLIS